MIGTQDRIQLMIEDITNFDDMIFLNGPRLKVNSVDVVVHRKCFSHSTGGSVVISISSFVFPVTLQLTLTPLRSISQMLNDIIFGS